jgi:hypothetical protein
MWGKLQMGDIDVDGDGDKDGYAQEMHDEK